MQAQGIFMCACSFERKYDEKGMRDEKAVAVVAHAESSREHISKVCSQLIIGTPPPRMLLLGRMRYKV